MSISGPSISGPTSGQDGVLPFEPGHQHELRVHGVAGSTPDSLLGLQAQPAAPAAPGGITVWRAPQVPESLRAWSWSSLTSGHWYQAFYLLLLPFMIANLAGWMLPSQLLSRARTFAVYRAAMRAAALALTLNAVLLVTWILIDYLGYQCGA